jgi:hypothetical protein
MEYTLTETEREDLIGYGIKLVELENEYLERMESVQLQASNYIVSVLSARNIEVCDFELSDDFSTIRIREEE